MRFCMDSITQPKKGVQMVHKSADTGIVCLAVKSSRCFCMGTCVCFVTCIYLCDTGLFGVEKEVTNESRK